MKKNVKYPGNLFFFAVLLLTAVMFVLPCFSYDSYSLLRHTTSQLGAQKTPNAWIMNITFMIIGLSCVIEAWVKLKTLVLHRFVSTLFGISFIFTGFFRHAPIEKGIGYSVLLDRLHSVFASLNGFCFIVLAVSAAFLEQKRLHKFTDILVALSSLLFSLLMFGVSDYAGLWQRIMFLVSFVWLILFLERMKKRVQPYPKVHE